MCGMALGHPLQPYITSPWLGAQGLKDLRVQGLNGFGLKGFKDLSVYGFKEGFKEGCKGFRV